MGGVHQNANVYAIGLCLNAFTAELASVDHFLSFFVLPPDTWLYRIDIDADADSSANRDNNST